MTIVVVEDELRTRTGLVHLLQRLSDRYRVVGDAENGYEGLRLIREAQPDLVITDVKMPKMDGIRMIGELRGLGLSTRVVILSGYAEFAYAQQAMRLGVTEYLLKPVTVDAVAGLLHRLDGPAPEAPNCGGEEYSPVVRSMVDTVQQQYGQRLGLDTFAERYRLTPEYLSVLFARETGAPFSTYLKQVRIGHAKRLLVHSGLKIYEIACRVGYPDQKYFSKVFKEETGVSPKQFVAIGAAEQQPGRI